MPKKGIITAPTGASTAMIALADPVPVTDTLPGIVTLMLAEDDALKKVIFNLGLSKAVIVPAATSHATVASATGVAKIITLTPNNPEKATSTYYAALESGSWGDEAAIDEIGAIFEARTGDDTGAAIAPPSMSVESVIGKLEDVQNKVGGAHGATEEAGPGTHVIAVLDQANEQITVYQVSSANSAGAHAAAVALAEDVQVVLTEVEPTPASPRVYGE